MSTPEIGGLCGPCQIRYTGSDPWGQQHTVKGPHSGHLRAPSGALFVLASGETPRRLARPELGLSFQLADDGRGDVPDLRLGHLIDGNLALDRVLDACSIRLHLLQLASKLDDLVRSFGAVGRHPGNFLSDCDDGRHV